eukprot:m.2626 g.2626  ORF g.2626 m.2626 type:complete len:83 (-) comp1615_c1_seq1:52-300(-)
MTRWMRGAFVCYLWSKNTTLNCCSNNTTPLPAVAQATSHYHVILFFLTCSDYQVGPNYHHHPCNYHYQPTISPPATTVITAR